MENGKKNAYNIERRCSPRRHIYYIMYRQQQYLVF